MSTTLPLRTLQFVDGLAQLSFRVHGLLERHASEHGLSMIQTRLLGVLRDRRPTINELARLLELDKSSVSGLVDRAQRRGLVTRRPSPSDGRSVLVTLTDEGRALVGDVSERFAAEVATLLAPLAAGDQTALNGLVTRVLVGDAEARGIDLFTTATPSPGPAATAASTPPSARGRGQRAASQASSRGS